MKIILMAIILLGSLSSFAAPQSKLFHRLIGVVNSLKASSNRHSVGGYPLSETPGYHHFKFEEIGESKEALQKLLIAGHNAKNAHNKFHNKIPGFPASEMSKVKMSIDDLLGNYAYTDEEMINIAKSLGYKGQLRDDHGNYHMDIEWFLEEVDLNVTSFRKVVKVLEPEVSLDIFK